MDADDETLARAVCVRICNPRDLSADPHLCPELRVRDASARLIRSASVTARAVGYFGLSRCHFGSVRELQTSCGPVEHIVGHIAGGPPPGDLAQSVLSDRLLRYAFAICPAQSFAYPSIALELLYAAATHSKHFPDEYTMPFITKQQATGADLRNAFNRPDILPATRYAAIYYFNPSSSMRLVAPAWVMLLMAPPPWASQTELGTALSREPSIECAYLLCEMRFSTNQIPISIYGGFCCNQIELGIAAMKHIPYSEPICQLLSAKIQKVKRSSPGEFDSVSQKIRQLAAELPYHPDSFFTSLPVEFAPPGEPWSEARHAALDRHWPLNRLLAAALLGMGRLRAGGALCRSDPDMWGETFENLTFADTLKGL